MPITSPVTVNGRTYAAPKTCAITICLDGCEPAYLEAAIARGLMPNLERIRAKGTERIAHSVIPSFTNPNNMSIATGRPPAIHGICGNYLYEPETGEEVMMNSASYLRCGTIFSAAADAGRKVAIVTAKEKLRDILSADLTGIAFSSERADEAQQESHGISQVESLVGRAKPNIYSADASLFVLQSGVALLEQKLADFLYLSLTDFMQHKFPPEAEESLEFYEAMDREIGRLLDLGAVVGLTADHGMNAKNDEQGKPKVLYLESLLSERYGSGHRVICPITDPYVVHHGALGSFVTVHLKPDTDLPEVAQWMLSLDGVTEVYDREVAAKQLELPPDRIGDLVVLSARDVVLGRTPEDHDLSHLEGGLRSHGGRYEEMVPLVLSEPVNSEYAVTLAGDPRNFDLFELVCNGVVV